MGAVAERCFAALRMTAIAVVLTSRGLPLTSQTSAQQTAFDHLHDSLAATSDTTALRTLLRSARRQEKTNREDKSAGLRSGLVALRLGELKADPDYSEARSRFREVASREPSWPEAWFGLGMAEAGRSEWEMSKSLNLGNRVGLKALERSANSHRRSIAADATYVPAALVLAQIELSLMDTARLAVTRDALRRVAEAVALDPPELLLALGRVERAAGALDSAIIAFEHYLLIGPNRALGLLELARTRLALGRADGQPAYYEGASIDDPEATAGYRADLRLLAADSIISEFDRMRGPARAAYLHQFWTNRDRLEFRTEGDRLREHYRRLQFARTHFPLTISRRFYGRRDAYRSGNTEIDDRGVIYLRHGEPTVRLRPFVFGLMPNESWRYAQAEGDLLLHFSAGWDENGGGDLYDYRLVESVLDLRGAAEAARDQLLLSRQDLSPTYIRILNWGRYAAAKVRAQERSIGRASIAAGTTTDTYELRFARRLGVIADLIAVGRNVSGSLVHFVFSIAREGTSADTTDGGANYPVRVRLVALDAQETVAGGIDTTVVITLSAPLLRREYLVGRAELTLPPGRWSYRASLQQGDSTGVVLPRQEVRVAATDGASLSLSDIALGSRGRAVPWITDAGDTVLLAPSALFRKGWEVELYYEVRGATVAERYRHEITILREDGRRSAKKRALVALSFDEEAQATVIRSRRTVRLDRLKRGSYLVEVKVTAPDGSSQMRRRPISLMDR